MHESLHQAMLNRLVDGRLPCNQAFAIAQILGLEPERVGLTANDEGIRISRCQLGLFGYGPKAEGRHKIVKPMEDVSERLAARLQSEASTDGITCTALWKVADGLGIKRMEASSACEAIGLRVSRCQLGCFPRPFVTEPPAPGPRQGR